jgi:hypothetical protein
MRVAGPRRGLRFPRTTAVQRGKVEIGVVDAAGAYLDGREFPDQARGGISRIGTDVLRTGQTRGFQITGRDRRPVTSWPARPAPVSRWSRT